MKIAAVGVTTSNLKETVRFYELIGFKFPEFKDDEQHLEPVTKESETRLMIDSKGLIKSLIGEDPKPGNGSSFAIEFDTPLEVDLVADKLKGAGYKMAKEPWDAFWGQRYAVVLDPDGYSVDLYARIPEPKIA